MIEKLRRKLMVLFLTCTMLIFTAAMSVSYTHLTLPTKA